MTTIYMYFWLSHLWVMDFSSVHANKELSVRDLIAVGKQFQLLSSLPSATFPKDGTCIRKWCRHVMDALLNSNQIYAHLRPSYQTLRPGMNKEVPYSHIPIMSSQFFPSAGTPISDSLEWEHSLRSSGWAHFSVLAVRHMYRVFLSSDTGMA